MEDLIRDAWRSVFKQRDRRPVPEWAHENVWLAPPITRTGWFDVAGSRHFIEIFASLQNDHRREVNILKPVRGGGSLIGDVFCLWALVNDPGPYMEIFQTDRVADEHAESRIMPNFYACKPVRDLFPSSRHKLRDNQIRFAHGHNWYVSGPSIGNLQTKGVRYLRLEEVWMWDQGKEGEALGRVGDYLKMQTSKVLRISQAGPKDGVEMQTSDWFRAYHRGVIHEWEVQCLNCGKYFEPVFSGQREDGSFWGVTWDRKTTPAGDWDIGKCVPTVRFECPHCGKPMLDGARVKGEWNRTGRYRGENPKAEVRNPKEGRSPKAEEETIPASPGEIPQGKGVAGADGKDGRDGRDGSGCGFQKRDSFHWEAVIDFPWDELVELWLEACNAEKRGDLKPKLQFWQKRRAIFKDEESLLKGGLHLTRSVYEVSSDWPEERGRALTVDRQEEDLYWWTVRAWSPERSRKLGFGKAYGTAELEKIRAEFKVTANNVFVDSGFLPKGDHGVYAACLKFGWIAVKGDKEHSFTHRLKKNGRLVQKSYAPLAWGDPGAGTAVGGRRYCPLIRFSKPQMNQKVQELIDNGLWEEPVMSAECGVRSAELLEMEKEYNQQMAARVKKTEYLAKTGETRVYWKEAKNDHARDLANAQVLFAILRDLLPDPAMERLTRSERGEGHAA